MVVIAGERSGVGKTTVTLALLSFLCRQGHRVQSFKVGPDYIDPMFHQHVTGRFCRNLDPVLTSIDYLQQCFAFHTQQVDYALVEGVMGLFDGASGDFFASTAHVALSLNLPVVLVIDCSRLSGSVAAIAHGYRSLDPRLQIAGVVLNRVGSDRHLQLLQDALQPLDLPVVGVLRRQDDITIPDRHLGLIPTGEINKIDRIIERLATIGETCFDWEKLLPLVRAPRIAPLPIAPRIAPLPIAPRIAIARDRAFNFYYQDNLDILVQLGAELVFWSPLTECVPNNVQGLYFGGGFPEVFAAELAANRPGLESVKQAISAKMPTYAECGGLMYLCDRLVDFEQTAHNMVGVIPATAIMGKRLTLGYRHATALQATPLVTPGSVVWGHEFHRSSLSVEPLEPLFQARGYEALSPIFTEGWRSPDLHASYIHTHFGSNLDLPKRFIERCIQG
ncbi:cobyrinate a,c-diamide synthase [Synechocystis sp. PCC 7509]|uniref:cobyrinate a,c-diamide synthase n=1 Tax=Synechocystis sp. PCC 7509 TaxID=927677 RepID=UPI0002AD1841